MNIQQLEQAAQDLLSHMDPGRKKVERLPCPIIIEITGPPDSGKSSTIKVMRDFLRRHTDLRIATPPEGAEEIPAVFRDEPFVYNVRTLLYVLDKLLNEYSRSKDFHVVFFDRAIFDAVARMRYYAAKGIYDAESCKIVEEFALLWRNALTLTVFLVCDADEAIRRDMRDSLTTKEGHSTNRATIEEFIIVYQQLFEEFRHGHPPILWLDSTHRKRDGIAKEILEAICSLGPPK